MNLMTDLQHKTLNAHLVLRNHWFAESPNSVTHLIGLTQWESYIIICWKLRNEQLPFTNVSSRGPRGNALLDDRWGFNPLRAMCRTCKMKLKLKRISGCINDRINVLAGVWGRKVIKKIHDMPIFPSLCSWAITALLPRARSLVAAYVASRLYTSTPNEITSARLIIILHRTSMSFLALAIKPLVYISVPVILLRTVASASSVGRYYAQLTIYLGTLAVVSTWGVFVAVGMSLIGRRHDVNYVVARSFYAIASRVLDVRVEVEGEEHLQTRSMVMVGNHQSVLDILWLGRYVPFTQELW